MLEDENITVMTSNNQHVMTKSAFNHIIKHGTAELLDYKARECNGDFR